MWTTSRDPKGHYGANLVRSFAEGRNFEPPSTRNSPECASRVLVNDGESFLRSRTDVSPEFPCDRPSHLECTGSTKVNRRPLAENKKAGRERFERAAEAGRNRVAIGNFRKTKRSSFSKKKKKRTRETRLTAVLALKSRYVMLYSAQIEY